MGNLNVSRRSKGSIFAMVTILSLALGQIILPLQAIAFSQSNNNSSNPLSNFASLEQVKSVTGQAEIDQNTKVVQDKIKENTQAQKFEIPNGANQLKNIKPITKENYVPGEVLVKYKKNKINLETVSGRTAALNFIRAKSLEKKEDLRKINTSVLKIKDAKTVEQKVAELKNDPNVEYVQPNFQYYPTEISTNDTHKNLLWGLDNTGQTIVGPYGANGGPYIPTTGSASADISAPEAWAINEGTNASVIVAVIDSGVAYNHPDLIANMWSGTACVGEDSNGILLSGGCNHGYDYEDNDKTPLPTGDSHGTHIAGTIVAAKGNGLGIIGVAPQAKIMALKSSLTTSDNIKSINFAKQNGAKVINASWACYGSDQGGGCGTSYNYKDQAMIDAIGNFPGLFITAAGNGQGDTDPTGDDHDNGQTLHSYPCDHTASNIICVAATDQKDALATFSDYGVASVDVGAPGVNIYSTVANSTSFSEDFEGSSYNVMSGGNTVDNWALGFDGSSWVAYSDKTLPYAPSASTWLWPTTTIDLANTNITRATLGFTIWCDTPDTFVFDDYILTRHYSNSTWSDSAKYNEDSIWSDEGTPWIDSGHVGYYKRYTEDISDHLSNDFLFAFVWITNSSIDNNLGCTVDDIKVTKYTDGSDEQYDYMEGTSMAAPHVAGLAALIEGYNPGLTPSQVKNTILTTGDDISALHGKTFAGTRINAQRALQAVNPAKAITAFSFTTPAATGVINEANHTIAVTVPFGAVITALVPTIVITGSSVSPLSSVAQDFTLPVTYTVTAADSTTQAYVVTVTVADNPDIAAAQVVIDQISALPTPANLVLGDATAVANARAAYTALTETQKGLVTNLAVLIVAETQITSLTTATIKVTELETATAKDLTVEANLTAAESAVTAAYSTFTSVIAGGAKTDLGNRFNAASGTVASAALATDKAALVDNSIRGGNPDLSNITTTLTNPLPASSSHSSGITWTSSNTAVVSNNGQTINRPVYADGDTAVTLTATISRGILIVCDISGGGGGGGGGGCGAATGTTKVFSLTVLKLPASIVATITSATYTVSAGGTATEIITNVPFGTAKTTFLAALTKGETNQTWVDTGISDPVVTGNTLVVTAQDETTVVTYAVTVTVAPVVLNNIAITTPATKLVYTVEDSLDITGLVVTGTYSNASTKVVTITTANVTGFNSSTPVTGQVLTITVDGKTATYTVNVVAALSSAKVITAFSFAGSTGKINENTHTIAVTVPFGTNVTALTPIIGVSAGASVSPVSGVAQDFTNPVTYTITAADGSTQVYTVTVTVAAPSSAKAITSFVIGSSIGTIDETAHTIAVTVSFGTDVTALAPTIAISDKATVDPASGVAKNFTAPVTYTVTAEDSTIQDYVVTVTIATPSNVATVTSVTYTVSLGGTATETITNVPFGTAKTTFLAALTKGETNQTRNDTGMADPVVTGNTLVVTAQDGTTIVTYTVTVNAPAATPTPTPTPSGGGGGGGGGWVSTPMPTPTPGQVLGTATALGNPANLTKYILKEGDMVSATGSNDPDVYIVNVFGYKRLFLNPAIFNFYGHLTGGWNKIKKIVSEARDAFPTSDLFRNCETNDPKVYAVEVTGEDTGTFHWINMTGDQAVTEDSNFFKKVFCINNNEFNWYTKSSIFYTLLSQVPAYNRK